jgi:hypothetical protein
VGTVPVHCTCSQQQQQQQQHNSWQAQQESCPVVSARTMAQHSAALCSSISAALLLHLCLLACQLHLCLLACLLPQK